MSESPSCAAVVVAQLLAQGFTELVLCPGSRSAPLALAALAAERRGARLHVRTDERSAAFLALGLARTGKGAVVITTSGTAVGNLLPAVMEASHSGVPLVLVTADRPAALVGTGANQTTDQRGIFGSFVRWQAQVDSHADRHAWAGQTARAVGMACGLLGTLPGPVHLNVALGLPLVDGPDVILPELPKRDFGTPVLRERVWDIHQPRRRLIVLGECPVIPAAMDPLVRSPVDIPVICDGYLGRKLDHAASLLRCGHLLLESALAAQIEEVIVVGHPTMSRQVTALLSRPDVQTVIMGDQSGWSDPTWSATVFRDTIYDWEAEFGEDANDPAWAAAWRAADDQVSASLDAVLAAEPRLTGWHVAQVVMDSLAAGDTLVVGASSPIRDLALARSPGPETYANRGLAGIDGTVATAIGVALGKDLPTTLYCGDLTFLHDANALAIPAGEPRPDLRIVVADDHGGSIFATLEYGRPEYAEAFERVFATPVETDLVALAAAHGVPARRVTTAEALRECLAEQPSGLEVVVVRTDRTARAEISGKIISLAYGLA
jgi:2-succinyl-5-enolpyruvyl-6-hydroxy-3-cyclohexene-1-carboxylate synthase